VFNGERGGEDKLFSLLPLIPKLQKLLGKRNPSFHLLVGVLDLMLAVISCSSAVSVEDDDDDNTSRTKIFTAKTTSIKLVLGFFLVHKFPRLRVRCAEEL